MKKIKNKTQIVIFIIFIAYFFYQHIKGIFWDFAAYELNARHWLGMTNYFEYFRPPLTQTIFIFLEKLPFTKYLFILIVSAGFFYSANRLINIINKNTKINLNKNIFLIGFFTPFFLLNTFTAGSELVSLTILQLFIAQIIIESNEKNLKPISISGILFGLLFLARYTNLYYIIFLFISNQPLKIIKRLLWSFIIVFPWLLYNFITTGNWFTSIISSLANNVLFRIDIAKPPELIHFISLISFVSIIAIAGLFLIITKIKTKKNRKLIFILFFIIGITLNSYFTTPFKNQRYMFNLTLPFAILFTYAVNKFIPQLKKYTVTILITIVVLTTAIRMFEIENTNTLYINEGRYLRAVEKIKEFNLTQCSIRSEDWIFLDYFGVPGKNAYYDKVWEKHINQSEIIVDFQWKNKELPIIYKSPEFTIYGNNVSKKYDCKTTFGLDETYLNYIQRIQLIENNRILNTDPCVTLFRDKQLLQKVCNITNFR